MLTKYQNAYLKPNYKMAVKLHCEPNKHAKMFFDTQSTKPDRF